MQLIKRSLRRLLAMTPYELRRRQSDYPLPPATLDNIRLALAYYFESKRTPTFVQIGACDGRSGDAAHEFIKRGWMKAVLVEPIESSFCKLKQTYEGVTDLALVQAAIGTQDGEARVFKVREGAASIDAFWAKQLASFDRAHLLRHGVPTQDIEEVRVPCLTLKSLLAKFGFERIDVLQVDTEGFDGDIVKMALALPRVPECISFENKHLDATMRREVFTLLKGQGYDWTHDDWNTLALHKQLTDRW